MKYLTNKKFNLLSFPGTLSLLWSKKIPFAMSFLKLFLMIFVSAFGSLLFSYALFNIKILKRNYLDIDLKLSSIGFLSLTFGWYLILLSDPVLCKYPLTTLSNYLFSYCKHVMINYLKIYYKCFCCSYAQIVKSQFHISSFSRNLKPWGLLRPSNTCLNCFLAYLEACCCRFF